jgi:hypothetical protein
MNFIEANKQIEKHDRIIRELIAWLNKDVNQVPCFIKRYLENDPLTDNYSKSYIDYLLEKRNNMINEIDKIDEILKNDNLLDNDGSVNLEKYNKLK